MIEPESYYPTNAPEQRDVAAPQTFARWRSEGKGPAYIKSGSRVIYKGADLLDWLDRRRVSTDADA
ncbi:MAG: helix-turn-helix domain-containing protein [Pseudomonadota bacterium]|nr:helix-turn-helix domain-containing protein [Pseudomonadota bacterium]